MHSKLTRELAATFANVALAHVTREYPAKMDHILTGPEDVAGPRAFHAVFYGSFDWHSCVHGFWLLARIARLFSDLPQALKIHALFDEHLTQSNEWVRRFLPQLQEGKPRILFEPVKGIDQSDPQTVHLHGLNFSRARMPAPTSYMAGIRNPTHQRSAEHLRSESASPQ
jgi:hypothetical protein